MGTSVSFLLSSDTAPDAAFCTVVRPLQRPPLAWHVHICMLVSADLLPLSCRGRLLVGTFVALFFNLLTLLSVENKPFAHVSEAASTSCLQEHVADLSRRLSQSHPGSEYHGSICGVIPGLSSILLPRMNPFFLVNIAGALSLYITYLLIEINAVDTASAIAIALMTFGTMYPMSVYSGKVLLQVSTLDGVLEVRNERFWTVGFGSLAGSVHVRIRRDGSEQMVLAHVSSRLHALVATLTVQIFKDDWIRPSMVAGVLPAGIPSPSDYGTPPPPPPPSRFTGELDVLTSTPAKPGCPPPEFSFNTLGRVIQPLLLPGTQTHRPHSLGLESRPSPYSSTLSQGWARPHSGLGRPPTPGYRTAYSLAPHRHG
ncbi:hypothetical protein SKAU_G00178740 [Synaphobranchus kaupii]|uniref:Zinc transporter 6 n=1 Tax=Synaphobranchus kaupii TaxID=118154 RepID=A0A9Q1IZB1_SYNKA|nr:hypothetical protein SKAU_G00178740 [Synaphobranchus kaupii]